MVQPQIKQGSLAEFQFDAALRRRSDLLLVIPGGATDTGSENPAFTFASGDISDKHVTMQAKVKAVRGKYKQYGVTVEDLHRERRKDRDSEDKDLERDGK